MDIYDPIAEALGLNPIQISFEEIKLYPKIQSNVPSVLKGTQLSEEMKRMISDKSKQQWIEGRKSFSQEKMKEGQMKKYGVSNYRHLKGECPHCGKQGQLAALQRWHYDKCKKRSSILF